MSQVSYEKIELVGVSQTTVEDAIAKAITHATDTGRTVDWFEVMETRGAVKDGKIAQFQVVIKAGCRSGS